MTGGGRAAQALSKIEVPNFLVVAIDTQLRDYLKEKGVNVWYKDIQACVRAPSHWPCHRHRECASSRSGLCGGQLAGHGGSEPPRLLLDRTCSL